jgi:hypothetical protein
MRLAAITSIATLCWAASLGAQSAPMLSLTPAAVVGDSFAGPLAIGRPTAVTVARNGDVIVFGEASRQIRRYTAAGAMTQAFDIPAGCRMVTALGFLGDTLWAADGDNRRLLLYPPGRRDPIAIPMLVRGSAWGLSLGPPATLSLLLGGSAVLQGDVRPATPTSDARSPLISVRRDGVVADTIIWLAARSSMLSVKTQTAPAGPRTLPNGTVVQAGPTMSFLMASQPFLSDGLWAGRPDGSALIIADAQPPTSAGPSSFTVFTYDPRTGRVADRAYPYTPIPLAPDHIDSLASRSTARMGSEAYESMRTQIVKPPFLPTLTRIRVGADGSVWLARGGLDAAHQRWTVLDAAGAVVGDVTVPSDLTILYADLTRVYAVTQDADDRPVLRRYDVRRPR